MAKTIVVSGGNSGIGLEAARQLGAQGNHLVLLGRDPAKGAAAIEVVKRSGGTAEFIPSDLSTHAGVREAAEKVAAAHPRLDGLILGAGTLTTKDTRTADGLHVVFATNYLSRYHLAQRLLPQLRAGSAGVVFIVAGVPLDTKIDFAIFPKYQPFPGFSALSGIQIANFHHAEHLAKREPSLRVAVMNVGLVKTDIMRDMPAPLRFLFTVAGPLVTISVEKSAGNATWLLTHDSWTSGHYWPKPGKPTITQPIKLDADATTKVLAASRELTGV